MLGEARGGEAVAEHKRKRRTREHVIADLSVNHVERFVPRAGHTVERVVHDYGIDMWMNTYNEHGEVENDEVRLQLKATDRLPEGEGQQQSDQETISYRVETADLRLWLKETMPCILILYDAQSDVAYWLYVQAYFEQLPDFDLAHAGATITIHIPRANMLDEDAIKRLVQYKRDVQAQLKGVVRHHE
jgi:hypothetical protein